MIGSLLWSIGESYFWLVLGSSIKGKVNSISSLLRSLFCTRSTYVSLALLYSFHFHFTRWVTKERIKRKERVPHAFKLLFHLLGRE